MPPQTVKILLIEDDPEDAELILTLLGETGRNVEVVHERLLTLGLRQVEKHEFHLVLLDLSLPDSWGIDTLRRLRRDLPELPVTLMTGAAMADIAEQAEREGAMACLFKQDLDTKIMMDILGRIRTQ